MDPENNATDHRVILKCKKCRKIIIEHPENLIISAHCEDVEKRNLTDECSSLNDNLWYLLDETTPSWISLAIEKGDWTKGKLSCPFCNSRVGSFDFVSGNKCACNKNILPSVHIVKEKVDKSCMCKNCQTESKLWRTIRQV